MSNINLVDVVADRIKTSELGALIKDEDLYDIVKQGIDRAFFQERRDTSGYNSRALPPLIIETLQDVLKDAMKPQIERWVAANSGKLAEMMKEHVEAGIIQAADRIVQQRVEAHIGPILQQMITAINQDRRAHDLPPIDWYRGI